MSEPAPPAKTVWPALRYRDARAAIRFLVALGFEERLVVPGEGDAVAHCQLAWPEGGGVMLGTADRADSAFSRGPTGGSGVYVVTDDPAAVLERARAAGASGLSDLVEQGYGSLDVSLLDPEGNHWTFGTYRGEPG